ncbi:hypothetical protein FB451DRAFT_1564752 [Mycena latifolia]|nr:hypothetical protein FB451DRAFT_1564752 [Mycena latifolia]
MDCAAEVASVPDIDPAHHIGAALAPLSPTPPALVPAHHTHNNSHSMPSVKGGKPTLLVAGVKAEDVSPWLRWAVSPRAALALLMAPPLLVLPTGLLLPFFPEARVVLSPMAFRALTRRWRRRNEPTLVRCGVFGVVLAVLRLSFACLSSRARLGFVPSEWSQCEIAVSPTRSPELLRAHVLWSRSLGGTLRPAAAHTTRLLRYAASALSPCPGTSQAIARPRLTLTWPR